MPAAQRNGRRMKRGKGNALMAGDSDNNSYSPDMDEDEDDVPRNTPRQSGARIKEACKVCGDEVSGYHYGVRTCEGCKAFFRRTIQKNKTYTCRLEKNCPVERLGKARTQRCCYCRFQQCINAGMKIDAVRQDRARGCPSSNSTHPTFRYTGHSENQDSDDEPPARRPKRAKKNLAGAALPKEAVTMKPQRKRMAATTVESPSTSTASDQNDQDNVSKFAALMPRIPRLVAQMKSTVQMEEDWKESLLEVLEEETKRKSNALSLEIICNVLDKKVYSFVEWARDSSFFDSLDYEDQKKLLQFGWNSYLMFDIIYHLSQNVINESHPMSNGTTVKMTEIAALGHPANCTSIQRMVESVRELDISRADFLNIKMILLLNPFVPGLVKQRPIKWAYDKCQEELKNDSVKAHAGMTGRFGKFMTLVTDMRKFADEGEHYLYTKARQDGYLDDTLLLEMIEMKRES